jgi:hypothetical protein
MLPSSNESDIQLNLHFLDCPPDSINRSLNDKSVMDHLYRAATNKILKWEKTYTRKESNRVTDIDHLALLISPVSFIPKDMTRNLSIEFTRNENQPMSIPIVKSENKTQSTPSIDVKTPIEGFIPTAPPLPSSLDLAIKRQVQLRKTPVTSPDQESLWANVRFLFECLYKNNSNETFIYTESLKSIDKNESGHFL